MMMTGDTERWVRRRIMVDRRTMTSDIVKRKNFIQLFAPGDMTKCFQIMRAESDGGKIITQP